MAGPLMWPLLIILALAAVQSAAGCQSYDGLTPQLWSSVFGSDATLIGPLFILSPIIFDVPSQSVPGGVFINATGALYIEDRGVGQAASLTTDFISVQGL